MRDTIKRIMQAGYSAGVLPLNLLEEPTIKRADKKKLIALRNQFSGKRCFIIGNGPSLNKHDLSLLKNEYSFGVNAIFYMTERNGFRPTFYTVEDNHVIYDNINDINKYSTQYKFFPSFYKNVIHKSDNVIFFNMNRGFYEETSPNCSIPRFSINCHDRIYAGQSVTIINLQLAFYLGFTEVYLMGMDFEYNLTNKDQVLDHNILSTEDADTNHFDPRYFGSGKKWHDPKLENVLISYQFCRIIYERFNRKIYNASIGGKLNVFDRVDYKSLF